jgi:hypothetical protein
MERFRGIRCYRFRRAQCSLVPVRGAITLVECGQGVLRELLEEVVA